MSSDDTEARSKRLAKDLLEALDSPERPIDAEKERADKAALEAFYVATGQRSRGAVIVAIARALLERSFLDVGDFEPIDVIAPVRAESGGEIVVRLMPQPSAAENARVLQLRLATPSDGTVSSQWLVRGSKRELDAFLSATTTPEAIDVILRNLDQTQRRLELP